MSWACRRKRRTQELNCTEIATNVGGRNGHDFDPHSSDPERKLNPNLVPWNELDDGKGDYGHNIIRRLPYVFAKADYAAVECPWRDDVDYS